MSKTQYTSGPWRIHLRWERPPRLWVQREDAFAVARIMYSGISKDEAEANARLVAAAPDLLEACEAAYASLGFSVNDQTLRAITNQLAAAIAKAKRGVNG